MTNEFNSLMTINEVATYHGVNRRTVHVWISEGIAPANHRIAGRTLFRRDAVEAFRKPVRGMRRRELSPASE